MGASQAAEAGRRRPALSRTGRDQNGDGWGNSGEAPLLSSVKSASALLCSCQQGAAWTSSTVGVLTPPAAQL